MADPDPNDWNTPIIEEFRANGGKVGGRFEGASMLLLTATGAKTGRERTTPLVYLPDGDRCVIFASKAGAPENPAWYVNLKANPNPTVEVGTEKFTADATEAIGAERDALWDRVKSSFPGFGEYEKKTTRVIPVVVLSRKPG